MQNGKKKKAFHIMRALRLQLKTGFMKEQPEEYIFMKRYPPLSRDTQPRFHKPKVVNIPYMKLYDKVVERNPIYTDEKVFAAYWNQEPQALTLAKKQYEYMQNGLDEDAAYHKAVAYVDVLENESYKEMRKVADTLQNMGAKAPFLSDPEIIKEINSLREKMSGIMYHELSLADQGEIDYLIQTKILKWNEVQRERRMKDPIFVKDFDDLRLALFPIADAVKAKVLAANAEAKRRAYYVRQGINDEKLITTSPFFLEDYIYHFVRIKSQPDLKRWRSEDRSDLSRWIVDCLAMQEVMETAPNHEVQEYLNNLRVQFFPMLQYPDRADDFAEPTLESVKAVLYANGVGYKNTEEGLYIRRFYKLPMLLFPKETMESAPSEDREAEAAVNNKPETTGYNEVFGNKNAEKNAKELIDQLAPYLKETGLGQPDYGTKTDQSSLLASIDNILAEAASSTGERKFTRPAAFEKEGAADSTKDGGSKGKIDFGNLQSEEENLKDIKQLLINLGVEPGTVDRSVEETFPGNEDAFMRKNGTLIYPERCDPIDFMAVVELLRSGKCTAEDLKFIRAKYDRGELNFDELIGEEDEEGAAADDAEINIEDYKIDEDESADSDGDVDEEERSYVTVSRPIPTEREVLGEEKWNELLKKYYKKPLTGLEAQRERFFRSTEFDFIEEADSEADLKAFKHNRLDSEIIVRARLFRDFEGKEQARRERDWAKRGVISLPQPDLLLSISPKGAGTDL